MNQQLNLEIHGVVQGINLRSMIKVKALDLELCGFVTNQENGTVKLVAEGEKVKLQSLVEWLNTKPGHCQIHRMSDNWNDASGEYDDFIIKY